MTALETDPTHTQGWIPALTGSCACCGTSTGSVFAMGHDARFRGQAVLRMVAQGEGWGSVVPWFSAHVALPDDAVEFDVPGLELVTIREALRRVGVLLGRDWSTKVRESATRKGVDPGPLDTPVEVVERSSTNRAPRTEESEEARRARSEARIDALMAALNRRPYTGQWGYFRATPDAVRKAARVQGTHIADESDLIDLFVVGEGIVERVHPSTFTRDESARES